MEGTKDSRYSLGCNNSEKSSLSSSQPSFFAPSKPLPKPPLQLQGSTGAEATLPPGSDFNRFEEATSRQRNVGPVTDKLSPSGSTVNSALRKQSCSLDGRLAYCSKSRSAASTQASLSFAQLRRSDGRPPQYQRKQSAVSLVNPTPEVSERRQPIPSLQCDSRQMANRGCGHVHTVDACRGSAPSPSASTPIQSYRGHMLSQEKQLSSSPPRQSEVGSVSSPLSSPKLKLFIASWNMGNAPTEDLKPLFRCESCQQSDVIVFGAQVMQFNFVCVFRWCIPTHATGVAWTVWSYCFTTGILYNKENCDNVLEQGGGSSRYCCRNGRIS